MAEAPKQNLQTTAIIAKLFDLDERRVQQLAKSGVLPAASTRPYKFDLLPTVKAYIKHLRERANGKEAKTADTAKAEADKLRAEADLKQSKAKIAEMQLKELEGKMHRSEDVEAMTNDLVFTVRSMIMALPGRLAMDVSQAASANEASALIRAECHKILNELAGYQYDPEVYQRRVRDREGWGEALVDEADD
ncbi:protoporphyrinogen oxidase [uncultured Alistipes sp.]|jgi:phage terminase Nu1 subunit (DNA packaging protein)|uniref:protoporphyrinogen oxidase n=1 Tax=uncultured Alistipes sp. TaxID=538949 RepID=UPI0032202CC2